MLFRTLSFSAIQKSCSGKRKVINDLIHTITLDVLCLTKMVVLYCVERQEEDDVAIKRKYSSFPSLIEMNICFFFLVSNLNSGGDKRSLILMIIEDYAHKHLTLCSKLINGRFECEFIRS